MARATYRRRPDGILLIVRHRRWQQTAMALLTMLLAFVLVVAFSAALTLYAVAVLPVLLGVGAFFLVKHHWRPAPLRAPAPPASLPSRPASLHRVSDTWA